MQQYLKNLKQKYCFRSKSNEISKSFYVLWKEVWNLIDIILTIFLLY